MPSWLKVVLQTVILFIALFAIGLLTRLPALSFIDFYALHAVLAAPFYALLLTTFTYTLKRYLPVFLASLLYACCLGAMHIAMGLSVLFSAIVALVVLLILRNANNELRSFGVGLAFGAASYPATLIAGSLLGSHHMIFAVENILFVVIVLLISIAISLLGALLGTVIGKRINRNRPVEAG